MTFTSSRIALVVALAVAASACRSGGMTPSSDGQAASPEPSSGQSPADDGKAPVSGYVADGSDEFVTAQEPTSVAGTNLAGRQVQLALLSASGGAITSAALETLTFTGDRFDARVPPGSYVVATLDDGRKALIPPATAAAPLGVVVTRSTTAAAELVGALAGDTAAAACVAAGTLDYAGLTETGVIIARARLRDAGAVPPAALAALATTFAAKNAEAVGALRAGGLDDAAIAAKLQGPVRAALSADAVAAGVTAKTWDTRGVARGAAVLDVARQAFASVGNAATPLVQEFVYADKLDQLAPVLGTVSAATAAAVKDALWSAVKSTDAATLAKAAAAPAGDQSAAAQLVAALESAKGDEAKIAATAAAATATPTSAAGPAAFSITAPQGVGKQAMPDVIWTSAGGGAVYDVVIASNADCTGAVQTLAGQTTTTAVPTALADGVYHACVTATLGGKSAHATNDGLAFEVDTVAPGDFAFAAFPAVFPGTPYLQWSVAPGATTYQLRIGTAAGCGTPQQSHTIAAPTTGQTLTALPDGTWYACLTALDAAGNGRPAANDGAPFVVAAPPGPFTLNYPTTVSSANPPPLTWTPSSGAAWYDVFVDLSPSCSGAVQSYAHQPGLSQPLSPLSNGVYYACVKPYNTAGYPGQVQIQPFTMAAAYGAWTTTGTLDAGRAYGCGLYSNGKVYAVAGAVTSSNLASTLVATDSSGVWTLQVQNGTPPSGRKNPLCAETGGKLFVWGGHDLTGTTFFSNGGVYDTGTSTWATVSSTGAPTARAFGTAVWDEGAQKVIVWGGQTSSSTLTSSGGLYSPTLDSWTVMATAGAPSARRSFAAVWTGTDASTPAAAQRFLIVWGGSTSPSPTVGSTLTTGGVYHAVSDSWTTMPTFGAPSPRYNAAAAWTGTKMIVWGGNAGGGSPTELGDGALFDPITNTWQAMSPTGAPSLRDAPGSVWTGAAFVVWGGLASGAPLSDGAAYDPSANAWTPLATGGPTARCCGSLVWDGARIWVIGGDGSSGGGSTTYLDSTAKLTP